MNRVSLSGRLTKDADVRYTTGNNPMAVAKFTLAVDRKFKKEGEPTADFITCTAFGKTAEVIEKYTNQGTKIIVEGRWTTGNYTNKDGQKVYTNECSVESIEFAESKQAQNNNGTVANNNSNGFMNIPDNVEDEGLPFQ